MISKINGLSIVIKPYTGSLMIFRLLKDMPADDLLNVPLMSEQKYNFAMLKAVNCKLLANSLQLTA